MTEEDEEKKREDHNEDDDGNEEEEEEEMEAGKKYQKSLKGCLGLSFFVLFFYFFLFCFFLDISLHLYNWVCLFVLPSISWSVCQSVRQSVCRSVSPLSKTRGIIIFEPISAKGDT